MLMLPLVVLTALSAAAGSRPAAERPAAPRFVIPRLVHQSVAQGRPVLDRSPGIRVWTPRADVYRRGDRVHLYYSTERDAYVTIFRVDTDGRVQVLFPRTPDDDNLGYGGATYTVSNFDRDAFYVDDYPGVGYIFGVASARPFDYNQIVRDGRWDVRMISDGRIHGDPRAALEDLSAQLMAQGFTDYDTHTLPYYVEQHYDYPRFVCYDCHAYTPYSAWDPYSAWCPRYQLVQYNDPFYFYPSYWYPTRYYRGNRVVFTGGYVSPRYVFAARTSSAPGIAYRDRGASEIPAGRGEGRGVRAVDIGGVGSVPAPRQDGRRTAPVGGAVSEPAPRGEAFGRGRDDGRGTTPQGGDTRRREIPGIEIVPRPSQPGDDNRRRVETARPVDQARPARPEVQGRRPGDEPRPPKPEAQPRAVAPRAETPRAVAPRAETPRAEAPRAEAPRAEPQRREAPQNRPAEAARPASPPPRATTMPQARPSSPAPRGSSPQLTRRRP